jgi:hypothetical protein
LRIFSPSRPFSHLLSLPLSVSSCGHDGITTTHACIEFFYQCVWLDNASGQKLFYPEMWFEHVHWNGKQVELTSWKFTEINVIRNGHQRKQLSSISCACASKNSRSLEVSLHSHRGVNVPWWEGRRDELPHCHGMDSLSTTEIWSVCQDFPRVFHAFRFFHVLFRVDS